jgi:hypothetical protein
VLRDNSIPFSESKKESVCDACQMAKSHQLPYPKPTSISTSPLELVFSDVWVQSQNLLVILNIM